MGTAFKHPRDFEFKLDHPEVCMDADVIGKVADFVCRLLGFRLRSVMWHVHGYPGSFSKLLDPEQAQVCLQTLEQDYSVWIGPVANMAGPWWRHYQKRSVFKTMPVLQVPIEI